MKILKPLFAVTVLFFAFDNPTVAQFVKVSPPRVSIDFPRPSQTPSQPRENVQPPQQLNQETQQKESSEQKEKVDTSFLNISERNFDWQQDWWKYLIILAVVVGALYFFIKVCRSVLRFLGFLICLAFGSAIAYMFGAQLAPWVETNLPWLYHEQCPPLYWAYFFVFILGYLVACLVLFILVRPFKITKPSDSKKKSEE